MNEVTKDIWAAEEALKQYPQTRIDPKHYFSPGVYAREIKIPAGTMVVGQMHKYPQLNVMSQGVMDVVIDGVVYRIEAPFTIVSPAGTKRIAFAWTDVTWTTILGTDMTDVAEIEDYFVAKTEQEYLTFLGEQLCLSSQ